MALQHLACVAILLWLAPSYICKRYNTTSQRVENKLNVHLVCHTHDDAGWLKTVDQYYWGANNSIQTAGVQYILDSVIETLAANPDRTFVYAEMAFFMRWWAQQEDETRDLVSHLISTGQLSIVNGGYVQHDEAAAHFAAMIDQTTVGHRFLKHSLGVIPRIGWQLDPFGHSASQADHMSAGMGFDALFIGRADHQDMDRRRKHKELEFVWKPEGSAGPSGIFTVNFASAQYGPPPGFGFEWGCPPVADDPTLKEYNVQERVDDFVEYALDLANVTVGNDVIVTMGSDFNYAQANWWYKNLDKLVHYVNADGRINLMYSSPIQYVKAKHSYNRTWPLKTDDLFPYSDSQHAFWTGYFTSRPTSKGYIRKATSFLQAARQIEALVGESSIHSALRYLEESVALAQHHDAITGTAKQHVVNDYHERLARGLSEAQTFVGEALSSLLLQNAASLRFCNYLNASICDQTVVPHDSDKNGPFAIVVYNPLAWTVRVPIRIPVWAQQDSCSSWKLQDPEGENLWPDLVVMNNATRKLQQVLLKTNATKEAAGNAELVWMASIGPLEGAVFTLGRQQSKTSCNEEGMDEVKTSSVINQQGVKKGELPSTPGMTGLHVSEHKKGAPTQQSMDGLASENGSAWVLDNGEISLSFDKDTGVLKSVTVGDDEPIPFSTGLYYYNSSDGLEVEEDEDRYQAGGAYIFRPSKGSKRVPVHSIEKDGPIELEIVKGQQVQEARQTLADWSALVFRLYPTHKHFEVEWTVGPVPVQDNLGKEVILEYYTPAIQSGTEFFTDSNGRHMVKRERNARPTWKLNVTEPVAGNYYPVTAAAYVQDGSRQLAVIVDRSQGAGSLAPGQLEFLLHRRLLVDDRRGVAEPLNETQCGDTQRDSDKACDGLIVRGSHHIILGKRAETTDQLRRRLQAVVNDPPVMLFGHLSHDTEHSHRLPSASGGAQVPLKNALPIQARRRSLLLGQTRAAGTDILPPNVHLLSLMRPYDSHNNSMIVRLAHIFGPKEGGSQAGGPVKVDLQSILPGSGAVVNEVQELSLSTNQLAEAVDRLTFKTESHPFEHTSVPAHRSAKNSADAPLHRVRRGRAKLGTLSSSGTEKRTTSSCLDEGSLVVTMQPMQIRTFQIVFDAGQEAIASA